jgi:hypothetical protein
VPATRQATASQVRGVTAAYERNCPEHAGTLVRSLSHEPGLEQRQLLVGRPVRHIVVGA